MKTLHKRRALQEVEYVFPYHYIPSFQDNFRLHIAWRWGYQYAATVLFLAEELTKIRFDSLLDIGCGDGRLLNEIAKKFPGKKLKGVDVSDKAIQFARLLNPSLSFEASDITETSIVEEQFDVITLIEVIEHIPSADLPDFIHHVFKFLKKDGYILLTTPSTNKKLSKKHFQHFTEESLRSILAPHVNIENFHYLHAFNGIFRQLQKVLINKLFILNHQPLLNWIFKYYRSKIFIDHTSKGHRLYVLGIKK